MFIKTSTNTSYNTSKFLESLFIFILLMFPPIVLLWNQPDNDTYWLIRMGEYIARSGFPVTEPLSFHSGLVFNAQQWLTSVIFFEAYKFAGFSGLYSLMLIVYIAIVGLIYYFSLMLSDHNRLVSFAVSFICSITMFGFIHGRPQIFSYLLLLMELILLEKYVAALKEGKRGLKPAIGLVLVSLGLINMHAALWMMFFVFAFPYLVDGVKRLPLPKWVPRPEGYRLKPLIITLGLCFLVGLVNPYGPKGMFYLFHSYGNKLVNDYVAEMSSPDFKGFSGQYTFLIYLLILSGYLIFKGRTRPRFVLLTISTAYLGLSSLRSIPLFMITAFPFLAFYAKDIQPQQMDKTAPTKNIIRFRFVCVCLLIVLMGYLLYQKSFPDYTKNFTPKGAVIFLKNNVDLKNMRIFNDYETGGYLAFNDIRVFIDSRAEVFTRRLNRKADILADYIHLYKGQIYYRDLFRKYRLTHALVKKKSMVNILLARDSSFKRLYQDQMFVIYECHLRN